jgi:hypothetical protein
MAKKKNKTILYIIGIIIALFLFKSCQDTGSSYSSTTNNYYNSEASSNGGGAATSTQPESSNPFSWFFDIFKTRTPPPVSGCTSDSDCSNICSNPANARCSSGTCSCSAPQTDENFAVRSVFEPECSRNSDCSSLCVNPNNAVCNSGECGCSLPVAAPTYICSDSDTNLLSRGDSLNYQAKGACEDTLIGRGDYDYCSRGMLVEHYCRNSQCASIQIDCAAIYGPNYFCYDGMCTTLA